MGIHYICGTCDSSSERLFDELGKKINEATPNDDGTLDIEFIVRGKSEHRTERSEDRVTLSNLNAEELKSMMNFNQE